MTLQIYLSNGGLITLVGGNPTKEQLIEAIDEGRKWISLENKTINTNFITWFEEIEPNAQEVQKG